MSPPLTHAQKSENLDVVGLLVPNSSSSTPTSLNPQSKECSSNFEELTMSTSDKSPSAGAILLSKVIKLDQVKTLTRDGSNWDKWDYDIKQFLVFTPGAKAYLNPLMVTTHKNYDVEQADYVDGVLSWTIDRSLGLSIQHLETPAERYAALKTQFSGILFAARVANLRQIISMKFDSTTTTIDAHLASTRDISDRLSRIGLSIGDDTLAILQLISMPDSYKFLEHTFEYNIDSNKTSSISSGAMSCALAAAAVSLGSSTESSIRESSIMQVDVKKLCFYCKEPGHVIADCAKRAKKELLEKEKDETKSTHNLNVALVEFSELDIGFTG
ncbi:hypothetical protein DFH28DRAFT_896751 [Melampsora americana]|nr:hypothetical protein DFH28DRAFT_896751 [Melampsora americana]